jgi:Na+/proline symporter
VGAWDTIVLTSALGLPLVLFLFMSWRSHQKTSDLEQYFLGDRLTPSGFFATLSMSMAGLANILFVFSIWGYQYGLSATVYGFLFWICGLFFFRYIFGQPQVRDFVSNMGTLHEFLGSRHGPDGEKVRAFAAKVSIASFLIVIGFEVYVGAQIIQVFVPKENLDELGLTTNQSVLGVALLLCTVVAAYSAIGGYRSVIETDKIQGLLLLCAFGLTLYLTYDIIAAEVGKATLRTLLFSTGDYNFGFFVLTNLIGWTLWFPTTMDMWQRCAATRSADIPRKQIIYSLSAFFAITVFGVIIGVYVKQTLPNENSLYPLLDFLRIVLESSKEPASNIWPLAILLAGFVAAMMSTVDTFTIAATQAYFSDIRLAKRFTSLSSVPHDLQRREVSKAMLCAFVIPISTFLIFFLIHLAAVNPVAIFIIGYSFQLSLIFPILFSIFGRTLGPSQTNITIALGVLAVTAVGAVAILWLYREPQNPSAWYVVYSVQLVAVLASGVAYMFFRRISQKTAVEE